MIETKRLFVRRFLTSDLEEFKVLIRDKMSTDMAPYDDQYPTDDASLQNILNYFTQTDEFLAVELKETNALIGYLALNKVDAQTKNLGYCILSSLWNKGYATEAVGELINYAKNVLHTKKLVSGTALINIPSVKLLKRFGFVEVSQGQISFARDENGPIVFIGASYELSLE